MIFAFLQSRERNELNESDDILKYVTFQAECLNRDPVVWAKIPTVT